MIVPQACEQGLCAPDFTMAFEVSLAQPLEAPGLHVELLADEQCGIGYALPEGVPQGSQPVRFNAREFVLDGGNSEACPYPDTVGSVTTGTARAILTSRGRDLAQADFALSYTFAGPPVAKSATTPMVTELCWEIPGPSGGWCGDEPLADDSTDYRCKVADDDGEAVTVTLSFRSAAGCLSDRHCWTESKTFDPRLVAIPVTFGTNHTFPETAGARLTCRAVDSRGRSSPVQSVCFGGC